MPAHFGLPAAILRACERTVKPKQTKQLPAKADRFLLRLKADFSAEAGVAAECRLGG
jgi:hypothetical protein